MSSFPARAGSLPLGKLPVDFLSALLARAPISDARVRLGPGIGLDCAVIELGETCLVLKSDPITFATDSIGWYAVQINANDIVTSGATPRWLLATLLLPEGHTSPALVESIAEQLFEACRNLDISMVGGHTEVTYGLDRPILAATLIGEVRREDLITPRGATSGDCILLTQGVPIEATALLARELPHRLADALTPQEVEQARRYLYEPGISVVRAAQLARRAGKVTAMHDPTEGGVLGALWELAFACGHCLEVDSAAIPVPELAARACAAVHIDPLAAIASGALLLTAAPQAAARICRALEGEGLPCAEIGRVIAGLPEVVAAGDPTRRLPRPERDALACLFEET